MDDVTRYVCFVVLTVAAAIKELNSMVLPEMAAVVRHYTMVAVAQQSGKCTCTLRYAAMRQVHVY